MRVTVGILVTGIVLLASGCGGDSDGSASAAGTERTTTTKLTFTGDADSPFCRSARSLFDAATATTPEEMHAAYDLLEETADSLEGSAPAEIEHDVAVFIAGTREIRSALEPAQWDVTKLTPELAPKVTDPGFQASVIRVVTYDQQVCAASNSDDAPPTGS